MNILTFSGYSKAKAEQGVSSLQSVSAAGTPRSLWERQGIHDYDTFKLLYCGYLIRFTFI